MLTALIMAGGKGTRFWPLSTEEKPKQFLNLVGEKTMIQMTVDRVLPIIPIERIFICTGEIYKDLVKEQLPQLPDRNIIVEPEGRNTAPCIALSSLIIERYYNDSTTIVLPSDHLIGKEDYFRKIIDIGHEYLQSNSKNIITLGITPTRAETGYGYIKFADSYENLNEEKITEVQSFVEKPNEEKAKAYIQDGTYLWNGGMFMWNNNYIIDEIKKYIPNTYEALKEVEEVEEKNIQKVINEKYKETDAISVDYAILEKSKNIKVIPSNIGWDDIGSWKAIERYRDKDEFNNVLSPDSKAIESNSNIAVNTNKKVVMLGVKNIMTVETDEALFIVHKDYMENLRDYKEGILNAR